MLADIEKWRQFEDTPRTWAIEAYVYGRAGQQAQARHSLAKIEEKRFLPRNLFGPCAGFALIPNFEQR